MNFNSIITHMTGFGDRAFAGVDVESFDKKIVHSSGSQPSLQCVCLIISLTEPDPNSATPILWSLFNSTLVGTT